MAEIFVQYKGTDICLDFTCRCGATGHFDGYFAYSIECGACHQVWVMPQTLVLTPLEEASEADRVWHSAGVHPTMDMPDA